MVWVPADKRQEQSFVVKGRCDKAKRGKMVR